MAKYLIQDIIPPEKKKHDGVKKVLRTHAHAEAEKETPRRVTHHAKTIHESPHESTPDVTADSFPEMSIPEDVHMNDVEEEVPKNSLHNEYAPNPRNMLADQFQGDTQTPPNTPASWGHKAEAHANVSGSNNPPHFPEDSKGGTIKSGWVPWIVGPLAILIVLILGLDFLGGANVWVIAKHDVIPIPDTQVFTAQKNPTEGALAYAVMKVTLDDSREVPATGTKTVTAKASGKIVVYNEQSVAQRLIKNTRFQSTSGKIYRINDSITVPKASTPKGGKLTPGTLTVTIYADEAGPSYNSDPSDFTVPGLKDTPQAKKVYARSTGAIVGGASGTTKSVSDQDLTQASDDLRVSLETKLRTKARGDLASTQISFDQGIVVDLDEPKLSSDKASSEDKAVVTESGTLYLVVFDRDQLTKGIAKALVPTYVGENIAIKNIDALTMSMPAIKGATLFANDDLAFSLKGSPELTWILNDDDIKKDLLGISKTNFNTVMSKYQTIERAKASLTPFWKNAFPKEAKDITLNIVTSIPE